MPFLQIQTNLSVTAAGRQKVMKAASALISEELGKAEDYVMISLQPGTEMYFAGSDDPVAMLELKAIGIPGRQTKRLSSELCRLIHDRLGIPPERIYVKFIDVQRGMWGWKGDVF